MTDPEQVRVVVQQAQPNEIYLAAQSHVGDSVAQETRRVNVQGTENLIPRDAKCLNALCLLCHVFGDTTETLRRKPPRFTP